MSFFLNAFWFLDAINIKMTVSQVIGWDYLGVKEKNFDYLPCYIIWLATKVKKPGADNQNPKVISQKYS